MPLERRVLEKVFLATVKIYSKFEHFITNKVQLSPPYFLLECASLVISKVQCPICALARIRSTRKMAQLPPVPLFEYARKGKETEFVPFMPFLQSDRQGRKLNSHLCPCLSTLEKRKGMNLPHLHPCSNPIDKGECSRPTCVLVLVRSMKEGPKSHLCPCSWMLGKEEG